MRSLFRRHVKSPPASMADSDVRIDQMVDTMLDLMGDLKRDAERIEDTLKKTRQVGKQYAGLIKEGDDGDVRREEA